MKTYLAAAAVLCASANLASASLLAYEPFNYDAGPLMGQSNASTGTVWQRAASQTTTTAINVNGSNALAITGVGNTSGGSNRLAFAPFATPLVVTSGTVYYSLTMKVTETTGSNATTGGFFVGLNNTGDGPTTTNPSVVGAKIQVRQDPSDATNKYNMEIVGNHNAAVGDANWALGGSLNVGDDVFVVAAYDLGTNTSSLWINPDPLSFGLGSAPTATMTDSTGTALTQVGSVLMRQSPTPYITLDNLRVGTTWADVTSVPEPASLSLAGLAAAGLLARRNRRHA